MHLLCLCLMLAFGTTAPPEPGSFTTMLWQENRDVYEQILRHPFLEGLQSGSLDRKAFAFYMMQDAQYLAEFARALSVTASKSPREDWAAVLNRHAADSLNEERRLHESVFRDYGISHDQVVRAEPAPEAFAYMSFLVATAYSRPFSEALSALLPCYWIYAEVGKELKKSGSKDPVYRRWIENYSSEGYDKTVQDVLAITDEVARSASPAELQHMRENFRRSCRYEWMFWDSAFHQRRWPPAVK
jgi:thiaminase/transcriptional activator TenA